jgi:hypothetical protein
MVKNGEQIAQREPIFYITRKITKPKPKPNEVSNYLKRKIALESNVPKLWHGDFVSLANHEGDIGL